MQGERRGGEEDLGGQERRGEDEDETLTYVYSCLCSTVDLAQIFLEPTLSIKKGRISNGNQCADWQKD